MRRLFLIATGLIMVFIAAIWVYRTAGGEKEPDYKTQDIKVKSIRRMVELCTSDIHEEMAVKDSINGKWIVARQTINGRIRFDLDKLRIEENGDTTLVYLPPERVDILESTSPDSYEILDMWDSRNPLFERTLTASEENILKTRWQKKARQRIYQRGYVEQAREHAVVSLTPLLNAIKGADGKTSTVIIIDPYR